MLFVMEVVYSLTTNTNLEHQRELNVMNDDICGSIKTSVLCGDI